MIIVRFTLSLLPKANLYLQLFFEFLLFWCRHKNHELIFSSQITQNFRCQPYRIALRFFLFYRQKGFSRHSVNRFFVERNNVPFRVNQTAIVFIVRRQKN